MLKQIAFSNNRHRSKGRIWLMWLALWLIGVSTSCATPAKNVVATGDFPSEPLWTFNAKERVMSLASTTGRVFVSTSRKLYSLDAADGHLLWQTDLANQQYYPPIVCGDVLVSPAGDASLTALSANTGQILWEDTETHDSQANIVSVNCKGNIVITSRFYGVITAYLLDTGQVLWTQNLSLRSGADVAIIGDTAYTAASGSGVFAFNVHSGEQRFQSGLEGMALDFLFLEDGLYVTVFKNSGHELLVRLNPDNGNVMGNIPLPQENYPSEMAYVNHILYFSTGSGVMAVSLENGKIVWENEGFGGLSGLIQQKPVILANKLYVRDATKLHVLDAQNGLYLGSLTLGGSLSWDFFSILYPTPVVVNQQILVVSISENLVYAYRP